MKSEEEIEKEIESLEKRMRDMVTGSPDWSRVAGKRDALKWVLRE